MWPGACIGRGAPLAGRAVVQGLQPGGEGAQGRQELEVGACDNVGHGGCRGDCEDMQHPAECTATLFFDAFGSPAPATVTDCLCRINPNRRRSCFVPYGRGQRPEPTLHRLASPLPRNFAFALPYAARHGLKEGKKFGSW